jgi:hypothetical protein
MKRSDIINTVPLDKEEISLPLEELSDEDKKSMYLGDIWYN